MLDTFHIGEYKFMVEFDSGSISGGEISVFVLDRSGKDILVRTFYFEHNGRHIRAFARKFAEDDAYRQACLDGTVRWNRLARWYERNADVYHPILQPILAASTPEELRAMERTEQWAMKELRLLYKLLERKLDELETSPEYQAHLRIESQTPEPSPMTLDEGIAKAVSLFNSISGVQTQFSCEGIRRGIIIVGIRSHLVPWQTHAPCPYSFCQYST